MKLAFVFAAALTLIFLSGCVNEITGGIHYRDLVEKQWIGERWARPSCFKDSDCMKRFDNSNLVCMNGVCQNKVEYCSRSGLVEDEESSAELGIVSRKLGSGIS